MRDFFLFARKPSGFFSIDVSCLYINVHITLVTISMRPTRMKSQHWLFTTCVVFYMANHVLLAGATPNTTILYNCR